MIAKYAIHEQSSTGSNQASLCVRWIAAILALTCLTIVYVLCYGPILRQVGFYLDDWSMWCYLQSGPREFLSLLAHCLRDDKVIIRPLEAPYFTALYLCFGASPLGYHIVNATCEIAGAWFLCLALTRLTGNMALCLVASSLFLLNPIHDATHYWITASSVTVSLSLFLCSFWLCLKGVQESKLIWIIASVLIFAASVFNYESFAPLSLLIIVTVFFEKVFRSGLVVALRHALLIAMPFFGIVISMWFYKQQLLPLLNIGYVIPVSISPTHVSQVMEEGWRMAVSPYTFTFLLERAKEGLSGSNWSELLRLLGICLVLLIASILAVKQQIQSRQAALLVGLGLLAMLASYTIFAVASGYMPRLDSIWNRLNTGASVGVALVSAGLLACLLHVLRRLSHPSRAAVFVVIVLPVVLFFTLADWGYSRPWIISWKLQQHIQQIIRSRTKDLRSGDSIILANTPRYVMWSPLFDGVWDFQSMVRLSLNNRQINAGVVSERIVATPTCIKDFSMGYLCGTYPYKRMFLLFPCPEQWIPVGSADEFVKIIEKKGMSFGLDPNMPAKWRQQLLYQARRS